MYTATIDKDTIPADLLPGVEAANERLIVTLRKLGVAFDVSATWHGGLIQGMQKVCLDLVAVQDGREYSVKDFPYAGTEFLNPEQGNSLDTTDQHLMFGGELKRLNLDVLLAMRTRSETLGLIAVE